MSDITPAPEPAPSAQSAPILPSSDKNTPAWKLRKFCDNHALAQGGDVDIVATANGIAAFVPDPEKLKAAERAEIAKILALPRYAEFFTSK